MARMATVRSQDARLTDWISLGAVGKFFPPEIVDRVLTETERHSQRRRHLPAPMDGSYLSQLYASARDRRRRTEGRRVRVIEYRLEGAGEGERYRLITTLLDATRAPAADLARLYHERWEIENAFDELKTHLRGRQTLLRSQKPELVEQELCGLLLAHFAIRGLMQEAAQTAEVDPDRLSFVHSLRVVRRKLPAFAALPPSPVPGTP